METYLFVVIILTAFIAGGVIGVIVSALMEKSNGTIYLEKNEQGDDRIRFYLDMEYDDISEYSKIVFTVKKNT